MYQVDVTSTIIDGRRNREELRLRLRLRPGLRLQLLLEVEADVEDVSVGDDVVLSLQPLLAAAGGLGATPRLDEVAPRNHFAADESARDVGVDRRRRIERRSPLRERPGPRLLIAAGEEREQSGRLEEVRQHPLEARGPVAELGRLLGRQLGQLGLQLEVDAAVA